MEEFRTKAPFQERKSQNLTFWDFAKDKLFWQYLPLIAPIIGFAIGRIPRADPTKSGIFPFNGSLPIIPHIYEKLFIKGAEKLANIRIGPGAERLEEYTRLIHGDNATKRLRLEHDFWNVVKAFEVTSIPLIYHHWRNKESRKLDLEDACARLEKISYIKPNNEELRADNASLAAQLAFVEGQQKASPVLPLKQPADIAYDGKLRGEIVQEKAL